MQEKARIVKRYLIDKVPVSNLADEHKIKPSVIYGWIKAAMNNLELALDVRSSGAPKEQAFNREIDALKAKLSKKDAVIAEISAEYVSLKKELGEP